MSGIIPFWESTVRTPDELRTIAAEIRKDMLVMIHRAGGGHTGGSLSSLDILVTLYFRVMRIDPSRPKNPTRDRFVLSKGHSVEGYLNVLARMGFFAAPELETYGRFGSKLYGHPTMSVPGVEAPTGALGHGLSIGVGMALAGRMDRLDNHVYVLMGDGEQAEGSVWEAAMSASHYGLNNLTAIIDYNKLQISGDVDSVMTISSLVDRWSDFGWTVRELDGNDVDALTCEFESDRAGTPGPKLVLAHTRKGCGVSFMENNPAWHHKVPTDDELQAALAELDEQIVRLSKNVKERVR
ncbi:MAG: transketolase [Spirochaetaceae bacterium]|nr:MAG: transketolase [Spirochaetaceae bacterium]